MSYDKFASSILSIKEKKKDNLLDIAIVRFFAMSVLPMSPNKDKLYVI